MGFRLLLDYGLTRCLNGFTIRSVLDLAVLLLVFGVLVLLEILFSHLPLNNHQAGVDETFFE